jgi:acyl-CoA thioester hydrolase
MKFANATDLDRKSGVAEWRDLLFLCRFSRRLFSPGGGASNPSPERPMIRPTAPVCRPSPLGLSATLTSPMPVSQTKIRVRYAETDQMGVVYYANFFIWFEVGRVELLRQLGFHYKQMEIDDDCHIPVVEANCRYKSPARYDDELLLETSILTMRRSVIKFGYRLLRPGSDGMGPTLLAEGETTHVTVNRSLHKVPLPQKYAAVLQQFLLAPS